MTTGPVGGPAEVDAALPAPATSAWRVATSRDVGLYLLGNTLSNFGTWAYNLAALILVYRLTGSTFLVGAVTFAQFVGTWLLAPWAGAAADRYDRRRLLMLTQGLAVVPVATLAVASGLGVASPALIIGSTAVVGLAVSFATPALQALIPLLAQKPSDVDAAIALNSATFNLARAAGPVFAAALISVLGVTVAFWTNAASYALFVGILAIVHPRAQRAPATGPISFVAGLVSAWGDRRIRRILLTVSAISVATDPVTTLGPEYASTILGRPDTVAGYLVASFGLGALVSALFFAPMMRSRRHALPVAMLLEGVGIVGFALAPGIGVALAATLVAGFGFTSGMTRATSRLHDLVDDSERGRLMALWSIAFLGTRPLAALVDGGIAELLGVRPAAFSMALPTLLVAGLVVTVWATSTSGARTAAE